ncbi:hypothetical protein [Nonomuraea diastatica]|uniref:Uncharacterized protein n=1 Tax=Nonomuraea diastatica TaxID=1848329 RepID=A0A4R4WPA0_9ACTN|nr:hypothetical protein [Nonomuraea diastatica]TDD16060.1 hypothetical protein E1294_32630 [Nonomuraea diastatica]
MDVLAVVEPVDVAGFLEAAAVSADEPHRNGPECVLSGGWIERQHQPWVSNSAAYTAIIVTSCWQAVKKSAAQEVDPYGGSPLGRRIEPFLLEDLPDRGRSDSAVGSCMDVFMMWTTVLDNSVGSGAESVWIKRLLVWSAGEFARAGSR